MNGFGVIVTICLVITVGGASILDDSCEVLNVSEGDVFKEFIELKSLKNESTFGEVFRHRFYYNITSKDYLFKIFLSKASNVKDFDEQNHYWAVGEYVFVW